MIKVNITSFIKVIYLFILFIFIANGVIQFIKLYLGYDFMLGIVPFFDLYSESNLPTWFSSINLFISFILLYVISSLVLSDKKMWRILSVVFLLLSLDEVAMLHEKVGIVSRYFIESVGILSNTWVVAGAVFVGLFVLFFFKFWLNLEKRIRILMAISGIIYVSGALGFELAENLLQAQGFGGEDFVYNLFIAIEETFELIGITLFNYTLLQYLKSFFKKIEINFI